MSAAERMDKQYRYQRYVYDLSRKYYLLGRDSLLHDIHLQGDETLLEIGCGTARNLLKLAYRYPDSQLYGLDASALMLQQAQQKLRGTLYETAITLRQGLAEQINPQHFGLAQPFDHLLFSYVLSMIPNWRDVLEQSLVLLKPGGYLHVVDFSDQKNMPAWFQQALNQWLGWFHVYPDPAVPAYLQQLAERYQADLQVHQLPGRYAVLAHLRTKPLANDDAIKLPCISAYLDF